VPKCDICGKSRTVGNKVSHSNIKTKRTWQPNIQRVRAIVNGSTKRVYVCTQCMKTGRVIRAIR
jgi:large subunit ribosomal protein L28